MIPVLTPPTKVHARNPDCNFTLPPLDASLTLPEIYDFHYKFNPDHHVFIYSNGCGGVTHLNFSDVVPAADRAARYVAHIANVDLDEESSFFPSIAILATSDTITYFTTVLGLLRAGLTVVPISPRNSASAVAQLLHKTRPSHVLVSVEATICALADNAVKQFKDFYPHQTPPLLSPMPVFDEIYVKDDHHVPMRPQKHDWSRPRIIPHSSGSTGFPKPIMWNHRSLLQMILAIHFGTHDFCGEIFGCHGIAMYHGIGLNFISWVASSGLTMATFEPASPATIPTPGSIFSEFLKTHTSYIFGVPAFVEDWSKDPAKVEFMKSIKGVCFGGSLLNHAIGDSLVKEGISIHSIYGSTETGIICLIFPDKVGMDWEYLPINPHCAAEFIPIGDGTYELIIAKKPTQELPILNTKFHSQDAYATSDILIPHPTKAGLWKVIGRRDDQIVLSNGEKINPGPLESILCQNPHVSAAVMFGQGRFQNGIIIEPKAAYVFDPSDEQKLSEFRTIIWPTIEEMNAVAPTYSRLFKDMIIVASPSKPFVQTAKGAPKRAAILREYETEIEAVYSVSGKMNLFDAPTDWSMRSSLSFVSLVIRSIVNKEIDDSDDIFNFGCDSLQAIWIRNAVFHALRDSSSVSMVGVSPNLVYEYPTIASLAQHISSIAQALPDAVDEGELQRRPGEVETFLARYITTFPKHMPSLKDVVLVTGTTGALGSAVLAKLVSSDCVGKIFAYNRPSREGIGITQRQKEALRTRGYDEEIAVSPKVILVEGELTASGLGINLSLEEEIRRTVTHIIHIAWRVDFNLRLSSFDRAIEGVRALVDLALSSPLPTPPRLQFASSIGVLRNIDYTESVAEVPIEDPRVPLGQGYAESKWVAERILYEAAKHSSLRPIVVRLGQISGGINGAWNVSDWVPAMIKSSIALGCLPKLIGTCSWIPLDMAACALVEMRNTESSTVNLAHPYAVRGSVLFDVIAQKLSLPLVPYVEWEKKLEEIYAGNAFHFGSSAKLTELTRQIPAITIIDFFRSGVKNSITDESELLGLPNLRIEAALDESSTLRTACKLGADDVGFWLEYWKKVGFLP